MKITTQKFSIALIVIGVAILFISILPFTWHDFSIDPSQKANTGKIAQYGDFIGGVVGSIFSLAGVILFYVALREQREDFKTNTQVLTLQKEELKLQREELEATRKVFEKQSKTMDDQQSDNTFFNLLDNHRRVVESLKTGKLRTIRAQKKNAFDQNLTEPVSGYESIERVAQVWRIYLDKFTDSYKNKRIIDFNLTEYDDFDDLINHFLEMVTLYNEILHIHRFILDRFEERDRQFYSDTLKNSLTRDERFIFQTIYSNFENMHEGIELPISYYNLYNYIDFEKCELPIIKTSKWTDLFDKEFIRINLKKGNIEEAKFILYFQNEIRFTSHLIEVLDITSLIENIDNDSFQLNVEEILKKSALPIDEFPRNEDFSFHNIYSNIHLKIATSTETFDSDFGISLQFRDRRRNNEEKEYYLDRISLYSIDQRQYLKNKLSLENVNNNQPEIAAILPTIVSINSALKYYFRDNPKTDELRPKEAMSLFLNDRVFKTNHKNGHPIREILRELDEHNQLHLIPFVHAERKTKMTYWYFRRIKS